MCLYGNPEKHKIYTDGQVHNQNTNFQTVKLSKDVKGYLQNQTVDCLR